MRYQTGGAVRPGAAYVVRAADRELPARLLAGESCKVVAPRQMGKSSLRLRAAAALAQDGVRVATLDLSGVGPAPELGVWLDAIAQEIAAELGEAPPSLGDAPVHALTRWLGDLGPFGLFVDEVDSLGRVPFGDAWLAVLRALHERAAGFVFCLLGAGLPSSLNVGRAVGLRDFSREEARPLAEGLPDPARLDAILDWTSGHPYMTLRLCAAAVEAPGAPIDALVRQLFLDEGRFREPSIAAPERELCAEDGHEGERVAAYRRLCAGPVPLSDLRPEVAVWLVGCGIAADDGGAMRQRNRILGAVFDEAWTDEIAARRPLGAAIARWRQRGERDGDLLRGGALADARRWAEGRDDLSPEEAAFLWRSTQADAAEALAGERARAAERLARTRGGLAVGLAAALLLSVGAGLVALASRADALDSAERAEEIARATYASAHAYAPGQAEQMLADALEAVAPLRTGEVLPEASRALADALDGTQGFRRRLLGDALAVACAGPEVAAADDAGGVTVFSLLDGARRRTVQLDAPAVRLESADGAWVATAEDGRRSRIGAEVTALSPVPPPLRGVAADRAEMLTRAASAAARLHIPRPPLEYDIYRSDRAVVVVAVGQDRVLLGDNNWDPRLLTADGAPVAPLFGHLAGGITWAEFTAHGLVTLGDDSTLRRWDPETGRPLGAWVLADRSPQDVAVCGDRVAVAGGGPWLGVWAPTVGAALWAAPIPGQHVRWFGPDTLGWDRIYEDGLWRVWTEVDARAGALAGDRAFDVTADTHVPTMIPSDDGYAVSRVGEAPVPLAGSEGTPPDCYQFRADGEALVSFCDDAGAPRVGAWDRAGRPLWSMPASRQGFCPALSPDERRVVVPLDDGAQLVDVATGRPLAKVPHRGSVHAIAYDPEGRRFATASHDFTVGLWTADGEALRTLTGPPSLLRAVAWSPDGARVAAGGEDGSVWLWDTATGALIAELRGHRDVVRSVDFSPDGERIAAAGDGWVHVFPGSVDALAALARARLAP